MANVNKQGRTTMRLWRTLFKRSALALVAAMVALSWQQTGQAQAPCRIERGLDPLDVLDMGVRHNVWIVLDTSGSMLNGFGGGQNRIQAARDVLNEVVDEFVDASGRPLVNWGFVRFNTSNTPSASTACDAQFSNRCVGLYLNGMVNPPSCSDPDNSSTIKTRIDQAASGVSSSTYTPNGISMDQISAQIAANGFVTNLLPNQKNFVILVTDGDDTCECERDWEDISGKLVDGVWTPTASPPFLASNAVPRSLRGGTADSSYTITVTSNARDIGALNAGTKGRLAYERLNPTPTDRSTGGKGRSFVIGMGLSGGSPARAHHMAWEASGAFYGNPNAGPALLANDKAALKQALRDAFAKIGVPQSEVSLGAPTVGTVREVIPSHTNTTVTAADHDGLVGPSIVDTDDIMEARKVRSNHQNNVLFATSVEVPSFHGHFKAYNIYTVTDPANPRTARQADFTEIWDAGLGLQARSPASRNIKFNRRGETLLRDFATEVLPSDLNVTTGYLSSIDGVGAKSASDARDMVVGVIQGYRLSKHPLTGKLYQPDGITLNFSEFEDDAGTIRTWKLYDSVAGPTIVSSPPRSPDYDPPQNHADKYGVGGTQAGDGFYWDHFNRRTMVYLPTNAGMMHAFDGETGDEVFAYIPDDAMGLDLGNGEVQGSRDTLKDFVELVVAQNNGIINHRFLLSGSATVDDAFLRSDRGGDDQWHTLLAFGRGRGGRFVTVLDITDPSYPQLRFNKGNREGISEGQYDGLGETWSVPVMGNVQASTSATNPDRIDQWLAFLGGGYGCVNSSLEGRYLFALRVEDGSIYYQGQVTRDSNAPTPTNALVAMPTLYNPHEKDVADDKDYTTRVYIPDVQGGIWKLVTVDVNPSNWTLRKFADLGNDQPITAAVNVLRDINNQQLYVLAGTGADTRVTGVPFKFAAFVDTDAEGANTVQYPNGSTPFWERTLNTEERVYIPPVTIGEFGQGAPPLVFFAASRPTFDSATCQSKFFSSLYALGIYSGGPEVDLDGDGNQEDSLDLGQNKVTGIYARDGNLYVSESGGLGSAGSLTVYGDGNFNDELPAAGDWMTVQVMVDGFRLSPF